MNSTPNFDNLIIQALMGKLQINSGHHPSAATAAASRPFLSQQSLKDLLFNALSDIDPDDEEGEEEEDEDSSSSPASRTDLAKEESKLEKEIIRVILSGKTDALKPNSGQAVNIGQHHICVGFHEDPGSDYRVWEWHGHIMLVDVEMDFKLEYIYGNYFERLTGKTAAAKKEVKEEEENVDEEDEDDDEKAVSSGLRELIESKEPNGGRVLHRSINTGSTRCLLSQMTFFIFIWFFHFSLSCFELGLLAWQFGRFVFALCIYETMIIEELLYLSAFQVDKIYYAL